MLRAVVIVVMCSLGCYQPSFTNCAIRCDQSCPSGQACGPDGFCHADGDVTDCRMVPGTDASDASGLGPDAAMMVDAKPGTGLQGTPCVSSATDCAPNFICAGNTIGRSCHELCTSNAQCDGTGGLCNLDLENTTQKMCTTNCNPLTGSGCAAGWGCIVGTNPNTNIDHTDCRVAGTGTQGASCTKLEDCAVGFACIQLSPAHCMKYCVVGGANVCSAGTTCRSVGGGGFQIGTIEYGVCF